MDVLVLGVLSMDRTWHFCPDQNYSTDFVGPRTKESCNQNSELP